MTVVYLDSFLVLNFCINYFLLMASAKLAGEELKRGRFALSGLFGAAYAATTFFPPLCALMHPICKIGAAVLMILIAFGGARGLLRLSILFLALSCAFGGGILALQLLRGTDDVLYSAMDFKWILVTVAFFYGVLTTVFHKIAVHTQRELLPVALQLADRTVKLKALQDSGNTLRDPLTERPVLVVEGARIQDLFPDLVLNRETLSNPIETLQTFSNEKEVRFRLLPYRAVGVDCGMLLTVRLDCVTVNAQSYDDYLVALSPNPVSDGGGYHALIGCQPAGLKKKTMRRKDVRHEGKKDALVCQTTNMVIQV